MGFLWPKPFLFFMGFFVAEAFFIFYGFLWVFVLRLHLVTHCLSLLLCELLVCLANELGRTRMEGTVQGCTGTALASDAALAACTSEASTPFAACERPEPEAAESADVACTSSLPCQPPQQREACCSCCKSRTTSRGTEALRAYLV